jgi:hypothetical protein
VQYGDALSHRTVYDVGTAALCGRLGTAGGEVVDIYATPADSLVAAFLNINEV